MFVEYVFPMKNVRLCEMSNDECLYPSTVTNTDAHEMCHVDLQFFDLKQIRIRALQSAVQ